MGKAKKKAAEEIGEAEKEARKEVKEESIGGGGESRGVEGLAAPPPARKRGRPRKVILPVVQEAHEATMKADDSFSKEELLQKAVAESKSKKHVAESKNDVQNGPPPPPKIPSRREGSRRKSEPKRAAH